MQVLLVGVGKEGELCIARTAANYYKFENSTVSQFVVMLPTADTPGCIRPVSEIEKQRLRDVNNARRDYNLAGGLFVDLR